MLEFHDDYIKKDEKTLLAIRFNNVNHNGNAISPYNRYHQSWPNDAKSVNETEPEESFFISASKGIYAVPLEHFEKPNVVLCMLQPKSSESNLFYLIEYYPTDIVGYSEHEVAVSQCNIVKRFTKSEFLNYGLKYMGLIIEAHNRKMALLPLNSHQVPIKRVKELIRIFLSAFIEINHKETKNDKEMLYKFFLLMSMFSFFYGSKNDIDRYILLFTPMFVVYFMGRNYHDREYIRTIIESEKNTFDLKDFHIYGITESVFCCLNDEDSDVEEVCYCKEAYYLAKCKMNGEEVDVGRLSIDIPRKVLELALKEIFDELRMDISLSPRPNSKQHNEL